MRPIVTHTERYFDLWIHPWIPDLDADAGPTLAQIFGSESWDASLEPGWERTREAEVADTSTTPGTPETAALSPLEIARAQLEQVLGLTGSAIQRTQNAAVERVIQGKVSPALQRIPMLGSKTEETETGSDESWNGC